MPGDQNKALELLKRGTEFLLKIYKNKKYTNDNQLGSFLKCAKKTPNMRAA